MTVHSALMRASLAVGLAFASAAIAPTPSHAAPGDGEREIASRVAFFETIELGGLRMSAANIFHDQRCADPAFCFTSGDMAISVILFTDEGLREVILRLGEPADVPGGTLLLANAGTPPSANGAIELERYALELVFVRGEGLMNGAGASARNARLLDPLDRLAERPIEFAGVLVLAQILQQPAAEAGDHAGIA